MHANENPEVICPLHDDPAPAGKGGDLPGVEYLVALTHPQAQRDVNLIHLGPRVLWHQGFGHVDGVPSKQAFVALQHSLQIVKSHGPNA